jgi:DHA2 family multidrug resistance protein
VFCALFEIVDVTIVNVALNNMRGSLGASLTDAAWVITACHCKCDCDSYDELVVTTVWTTKLLCSFYYFLPLLPLCGNANNIWELVAFRFIQGLGGGALLVTAQTIITESYPVAKRGMAQAIYGMGVIVGPTWTAIRGYIVDHFSWPYIFYINIPIGIIATLLTLSL